MKKLNKVKMKSIITGGKICLKCTTGNYQGIIEGLCYCTPIIN